MLTEKYEIKKGTVTFHEENSISALARLKILVSEHGKEGISVSKVITTDVTNEFFDEETGNPLETKLGLFLQAQSTDSNEIRYIAVGRMDEGGLTGTVYGDEGSGNFGGSYVLNGCLVSEEDKDGEWMDGDEVEDNFVRDTSREFLEACNALENLYARYDEDSGNLVPTEKLLGFPRNNEVVFTTGADITPVDFGNTYWSTDE